MSLTSYQTALSRYMISIAEFIHFFRKKQYLTFKYYRRRPPLPRSVSRSVRTRGSASASVVRSPSHQRRVVFGLRNSIVGDGSFAKKRVFKAIGSKNQIFYFAHHFDALHLLHLLLEYQSQCLAH